MQTNIWLPLCLGGFFLFSTGCVCGPGGACGNFNLGPVAYRQTASQPCVSQCDSASNGDFYSGPGPLARFFGLTSCSGGSCGEMYVDEWINEPPMADQCGSQECLQCGQRPLRSLMHAILGKQYVGGCETCGCEGEGIVENGAIIQDGYQPGTWSSQRGCNCGASELHSHESVSHLDEQTFDSVDPSAVNEQSIIEGPAADSSSPPARSNPGERGEVIPKPAPTLPPSSASRLNPATRRVLR